ncbi:MAG TPA: class I SAM-dependent methyltransferase [Acidimicrobiales bacterium]|nr:class I SAM-dependent methyltransferase [Acidimicrobiales bacterium]
MSTPAESSKHVRDVADNMRSYWDARAQENAVWYVDTSVDYEAPDMDQFLATGKTVVEEALLNAPVQPQGRDTAIEIGCGVGRICLAMSDHFDHVVGVDISESMVSQARQLVDRANVRFLVGTGADLRQFDDASADFITTFTVFQHMPRQALIESYVREAARVLRPGGVLAAQWNNLPHPQAWKLRGQWWRLRDRIGGPLKLDPRVAPEFVGMRLPTKSMLRLVQEAGLSVQGTKALGTLFAWVWAQKPGAEPSA